MDECDDGMVAALVNGTRDIGMCCRKLAEIVRILDDNVGMDVSNLSYS